MVSFKLFLQSICRIGEEVIAHNHSHTVQLQTRYVADYGCSYFDPDYEGLAANIPFPGAGNVTTYTAKSWNGVESDISLSGITYSGRKVSFTVTMPSAGLSYYSISNPGKGNYTAGSSFALALNEVEGLQVINVEWRLDGAVVSGPSVTLTAGAHTVEADIETPGGRRQIVTLEINAK